MANFMEELWNSVFVPGPTPTLLIATNVTFGALLLLLLCLLAATWSVHFLILSVLSAGLWAAINWFAREVTLAQAREESLLRKDSKPAIAKPDAISEMSADAMDSGDDTETEVDEVQRLRESTPHVQTPTVESNNSSSDNRAASTAMAGGGSGKTSAAARPVPDPDRELKRRQQRHSMAESTGSLSTDSEWEKVDNDR